MSCASLISGITRSPSFKNAALFGVLMVYFIIQIAVTEYKVRSVGANEERGQAMIAIDVSILLVSIGALLLNFLVFDVLSRYCVFVSSILFALLSCWLVIATPVVALFPVFFTLNLLLGLSILLLDTWSFFLAERGPPRVPSFPAAFPSGGSSRRSSVATGGKAPHSVDVNYGKLKDDRVGSIDEAAEMVPIVANVATADAAAGASGAAASVGAAVTAVGRIGSLSSLGNSEVHSAAGVGESKRHEDENFGVNGSSSSGVAAGRASSISGVRNRSTGGSSWDAQQQKQQQKQKQKQKPSQQQYAMGVSMYESSDECGDTETAAALMEQGGERRSDEAMLHRRADRIATDFSVGCMPRDIDLTRNGMCEGFR